MCTVFSVKVTLIEEIIKGLMRKCVREVTAVIQWLPLWKVNKTPQRHTVCQHWFTVMLHLTTSFLSFDIPFCSQTHTRFHRNTSYNHFRTNQYRQYLRKAARKIIFSEKSSYFWQCLVQGKKVPFICYSNFYFFQIFILDVNLNLYYFFIIQIEKYCEKETRKLQYFVCTYIKCLII